MTFTHTHSDDDDNNDDDNQIKNTMLLKGYFIYSIHSIDFLNTQYIMIFPYIHIIKKGFMDSIQMLTICVP